MLCDVPLHPRTRSTKGPDCPNDIQKRLRSPRQHLDDRQHSINPLPKRPAIDQRTEFVRLVRIHELFRLVADGRSFVREQIGQVYDSFGRGFRHKGVPQSAILMYRQALEFDPLRSKTMKSLAVALLETGQSEEAMEWVQAFVRTNPDDPFALYARALALRLEGQVDEAIIACNEALTSVQTAELYFLLGDCYEHENVPERALEAYRQSASLSPYNSRIFHHLGRVILAQGDTLSAIEAFDKSAQLESKDVNTYLILGRLYKANGQIERAQEIYSTALDGKFRGVGSPVYLRLGMDSKHGADSEMLYGLTRRQLIPTNRM